MEVWVALLVLPSIVSGEYKVKLTSDGPAVLDAPITFTGQLSGVDDPNGVFKWRWYDTASPGHYKETEANGSVTKMDYRITYPSSEYDSGTYDMTLTIYEFDYFFWRDIGKEQTKFRISRELNGHLEVHQVGLLEVPPGQKSIINSVKETVIDVVFHDPTNFLKGAVIRYFWFINTVNYGQTTTGQFAYNFTKPGEYDVEVTAIADFNTSELIEGGKRDGEVILGDGGLDGGISLSFNPRERSAALKKERPSRGVKMAIFQRKIVSKEPITNITYVGSSMLKHGDLVDLNVNCTGSAPWLFCWNIQEKGYNITGNETCVNPTLLKSYCEFPILWYFKKSDTYNVLVILDNDVSRHIEVIPVTVYDVARQVPVSIVIIPVASSIVVVVLIISGIALHAHYRNRLAVEVADFDFGQADEEELQYKSFWERLRESFGNHFTSGSDIQSEGSSVSGRRSVQMPGPVGIGYGSIT
jgi:hypothetical protein